MNAWRFLLVGYLVSVAVEAPILLLGLSRRHVWHKRLFAGVWLTACTYPVVVLVLPPLLIGPGGGRTIYLIVAETFAPVAECALFWLAFGDRRSKWRDFAVIVGANLASFAAGEVLNSFDWWKEIFGPAAGG